MAGCKYDKQYSVSGSYSAPLQRSRLFRYRPGSGKQHIFPSSSTDLRRPKMSCKTSYKTDYVNKEHVQQLQPRPLSPTRKHRPHPVNVYYLERLDARQLVCDVKTITKPGNVDLLGVPTFIGPRHLKTCTQDSFGKHLISPENINTRYSSNKEKRFPARGIVPITVCKDSKILRTDDHWLPGTLKLTTTMTMQGPFQYLPRKRKLIYLDSTAAGMLGGTQSEQHRYHNIPKCRGLMIPKLTIRSGI